jgi:hypothetical protein
MAISCHVLIFLSLNNDFEKVVAINVQQNKT